MTKMSRTSFAKALGLIAVGIGLDQLTKIWVLGRLPGRPIEIIPGVLGLVYAENRNAAFGLGHFVPDPYRRWVLLAMTLTLTTFLLIMMWRSHDFASRLGFGVVVSGALGNIVDRMRLGFVVDFVYVHWDSRFSWPNFNLADSLISIGVGILLVFGGRTRKAEPAEAQPAKS